MSKQSAEKIITDEMLLLNAIKKNDVAYLLKVFSKQGNGKEYVNFKFVGGFTLLWKAIVINKGTDGISKIVKILLENGADPNIESFNSSYPLIRVIEVFNPEVIEMLLKAGANPTVSSFNGRTALHYAAERGDLHVCKLLLDGGADANIKCKCQNSKTPLHELLSSKIAPNYYTYTDILEVADLLIKAGADVNALTKAGSTPLHIVGKSVAGIRFLIENGADPSIPNKRGRATIDTPKVRQIYTEVILSKVKLLRAQQRLAFATMMLDTNHDDKSIEFFMSVINFLEIPPFTQKTLEKTNELLNRTLLQKLKKELEDEWKENFKKSFLSKYKGESAKDRMLEIYRGELKNPKLLPAHRKELIKKKRTYKNRKGIPLGSSDRLSTSRQSRTSPSDELRQAISLSLQALSSSRKSRSVKSSSSSSSSFDAQLQQLKNMGLSDKEIIDIASEGAKKKSKKSKKKSK